MKRTRNVMVKITSCIICTVLLLCALPMTAAAAPERELQTVRVGFFAFDGYHMMDEDGVRSGYGYEFLQHLAGYTDWQYEYIGYDKSWSEMQEMLASGEIDILTSAQKTADRMERFDFSALSMGTSSAILTVHAGDDRYTLADYSNWSGMRVGMIENSSRNDSFDKFAAEQGFDYKRVYYDSVDAMTAALKAGDGIDAIVTSNLRSIEDEWILAQFDPSPFYIMVQKGNDALLGEVNSALTQLNTDEPGLRTKLMDEYYTPDNGEEIAFTPEERAFVEAMRDTVFTAVINPDRAPLSYFADGVPAGIISDVAAEIAERSGLNVEMIETADRAEYGWLIGSGEADICFDMRYDYAGAEESGYRLTAPYLDVSISRLYKEDNDEFLTAALIKDSDISRKYSDYLAEQHIKIVYYDTMDEVVQAVLTDKQDVAYLYRRSAELAVQNDVTNRLTEEGVYGYDSSFAVAVNAKQDSLLFSILGKTVASIGEDEIAAIDQSYTTYGEKPFSLIGYMYDYPLQVVGLIFVAIVIIVIVWLLIHQTRKKKRQARQLSEEQRRNELLAVALAAAEHADAAKSQFLSRVSHEMRTPLNAIIGFMALAKDAPPEEVSQYMTNSEVAAKQLLSVINDVLDMSSIESGKLKIAHAPFDFKHMVHSITSIYLAQCQSKGLQYETKLLTPVDEWLVGDQLRINQILINLLGNAVKFTETGHVWLSISQQEAAEGKTFLRFEVSDTGCGMSAEMQERLFKPFEQESSETARKFGGNGLGLSIVKSLVSMMDGAISVQSSVGSGTTFIVDMPFIKYTADVKLCMPEGAGPMRVLAVDDEPTERDYISAVLTRMGVEHTCVPDGDAALAELIRAERDGEAYSICLVDWKLPGMNGIEITRRIRERYGSDFIVIVVSAYEHQQADESAREAGANLFISKPLFPSSLLDLFMTLTGGHVASEPEAAVVRDFSGRRVLLAEDNEMNRMVAEGIIKKFGVECDTVVDGRQAVDRFLASGEGHYDAILMDIQMPELDGFEATRQIRAS